MKIKYKFATGEITEVEVSDEIGAVITASRKAEHAPENAAGYHDIYKKSLITITEMERLMGKKTFAEVIGGLVEKPKGKPALVPASDKRPAIYNTGADQDFTEFKED